MDESAIAAICAVPPELQGSAAERFFDLIIEMYQDGNGPASLADLIPRIEQRETSFANPAAQFSENLRMQGLDGRWADIAQQMVNDGGSGSNLAALREQYSSADGEEAAAPSWEDFRAQNVDFWSGWNGTDWPGWRTAFLDAVPAELHAEVEPQLGYLDSLDPAGQLGYLRDNLGFTINQQALDYYQNAGASTPEAGEIPAQDTPAEEQVEAMAAELMESVADSVLAELPGLASELGVSVEQLQAELAAISQDDIASAIEDGLSGV